MGGLYVTGNDRIDDIAPLTFFMEHFSEMKFTDEEIGQMLKPDQNCEMPWKHTPQKRREFLGRFKRTFAVFLETINQNMCTKNISRTTQIFEDDKNFSKTTKIFDDDKIFRGRQKFSKTTKIFEYDKNFR